MDSTLNEIFTELHVKNDIGMYYCGRRVGTNNHEYGPEIRNHYIFVLVNKGSAVLLKEQEITFASHDLLVMHPNEKIHYKALEPWSITWLGLYGEAVEELVKKLGITRDNPIIHISLYNAVGEIMNKICDISKKQVAFSKFTIISLIYEFFSLLIQNSNSNCVEDDYITSAIRMFDYNYASAITVDQVANRLTLNTAYFSRVFSERMGISPKQYLLNKRIERAKELLIKTNASIFEIANSVGYDNQFYFSRLFKKHVKVPPLEYRKQNKSKA